MKQRMLVPLHTYPVGNADSMARHVELYARHLGADVCALACHIDLPKVSSVLGNLILNAPAMIEEAKARSRARAAALVKVLRAELEPAGIPLRALDVQSFPTGFADIVADHARYHDIVLIALGEDRQVSRLTAEAVIFGSGRPVLLVPESAPPNAPDHVVIAWDGGRVAARAVADARIFLRRAKEVTIITVAGEKPLTDDRQGERLAEHLADHGIAARVVRVPSADRPVAEVMQAHVRNVGAGLLVMGGFGHSRMRDFVLGGATQGALDDLQVPVLVSH